MGTKRSDQFWHSFNRHSVIWLGALLVLGGMIILVHNSRLTRSLTESTALHDAKLYSDAIAEFRTLYTSEVISTVREHVKVTHDYKNHEKAVPLPATLSMLLGERIGEQEDGAETRLYSKFPFPYEDRLGLRDEFGKAAWEHFAAQPEVPFYKFDSIDGRRVLRYATADLMRPSCVNCHNTHPDTPRTGWKVGDVRGVLEVIMPMDDVEAKTAAGLQATTGLMVMLIVAGVGVLAIVIGRLQKTSQSLKVHVTELEQSDRRIRHINDELVVARDEALASSKAKSQFLANMSHELRTPLNAIIGYSEIMLEDAEEAEQHEAVGDLEKIQDAGKSLLGIISTILDLTRVDTGEASLQVNEFDVNDVIREAAGNVQRRIEAGGNQFTTICPADIGLIRNDRRMIVQCLLHLLDNAEKFTDRGEITLSAQRAGEEIRFSVADTGIGMAAESIEELYEPFHQADNTSTRRYGGAGLGLTVTQRFVELMGGRIEVDSERNQGSTFTLVIPTNAKA